jgi:hypothetical protein
VGFNEMLLLLAFDRTESTVRPSFKPDTLVGVFSFASSRSSRRSLPVRSFPVFRVYLGISGSRILWLAKDLGLAPQALRRHALRA